MSFEIVEDTPQYQNRFLALDRPLRLRLLQKYSLCPRQNLALLSDKYLHPETAPVWKGLGKPWGTEHPAQFSPGAAVCDGKVHIVWQSRTIKGLVCSIMESDAAGQPVWSPISAVVDVTASGKKVWRL